MGHCRPRALPDYHHRVLPRRNGYFACVRCHRRAVFQQYASHLTRLLFLLEPIIGADIRTWHANIEQHASEGVNKILIGNKCDWTDKRAVSEDQGRELSEELGVKFIETSAKINEGVEDAFFTLARCVPSSQILLFITISQSCAIYAATSRRGSSTRRLTPLAHLLVPHPIPSGSTSQLRSQVRVAAHR